jgi:hypothetical protein
MKHLYLSLALLTATGLQAQTTAMDFTANDCDGMSHTLFSELDAGYCVVIDLVMMNCPSCGPATVAIHNNVLPNVSDPTRVKFYSIGYTNSITCAQMTSWRDALPLSHPVFAGMSAMTTYYGGMGMPTVIVLGGGSAHHVYYNHLGYSAGQNASITTAINSALNDANGLQELNATQVSISPNPTTDALTISGGNWTNARVLDLQGREMIGTKLNGTKLDVAMLQGGAYILYLSNANGASGIARFEKR